MAYVECLPEQRISRFPFPGTAYHTEFVKPQAQRQQIAAMQPPIAPPAQGNATHILGPPAHHPLPPGAGSVAASSTLIQLRPNFCSRCLTQYSPAAFSLCPSCHPPRSAMASPAAMQAVSPRGVLPPLRLSERAPGPLPHAQQPLPGTLVQPSAPSQPLLELGESSSSSERFMMSSMLNVVNDVLQDHELLDGPIAPARGLVAAFPGPLPYEMNTSAALCNLSTTDTLTTTVSTPGETDTISAAGGLVAAFPGTLQYEMNTSALSTTATLTTTEICTPGGKSIPSFSKITLCVKCGKDYIAFCIECQDFLCAVCVIAHKEDMTTQDHHIIDTPNNSQSSSCKTTPPSVSAHSPVELEDFDEDSLPNCEVHPDEKQAFFCHMCMAIVCKSCALHNHSHHNCLSIREAYIHFKPNIEELLSKAQVEINMLDLSYDAAEKMTESIAKKKSEAIAGVHQIFQAHQEALAQREKEVIAQINTIADMRLHSLSEEREDITVTLKSLKSLSTSAEQAMQERDRSQMLVTHSKLSEKLKNSHMYAFGRNPVEDDSFILKSNITEAQKALNGLCQLTTAAYPPLCSAMGEGLYHPRVNRLCTVILCTKDRSGEPCLEGGERLFVQLKLTASGGGLLPVDIRDNQDGSYSINFRPRVKGEHQLVIAIRGQHISGSPFSLIVDGGREYGRFGVVSHCWGNEGAGNGQFCRPWGICCDQQSNIIVGDRSNHRIQIFDCNGVLKYKFGSEGIRPGQFNRPAGVAVTREGHVDR